MEIEIYQVGGSVRDEIMGRKPNDIDYTVVIKSSQGLPAHIEFPKMVNYLDELGYKRFLTVPDCFTVRAKRPNSKEVADFVMSIDRPLDGIPLVGTLHDDLYNRDFTINAIAKDKDGAYIDPQGGIIAIHEKTLRTCKPPISTFRSDPLRMLRAIRFSITLGFDICTGIYLSFKIQELIDLTREISTERIEAELRKCFKHDTLSTLSHLNNIPEGLVEAWFKDRNLWLMPTTRK